MLLGIFAHVEVDQLNAQLLGEHFGHFGFAHAGGADEEERGHGLVGGGEAGVRHHDGFGDLGDGTILSEDAAKQFRAEIAQGGVVVVVVGAEGVDLAEGGQHGVDEVARHALRAVGMDLAIGGGFVDEVDGFVGESAVVEVAIGTAHGVLNDALGKGDVVKRFVARAQSLEDEAGLFDGGFGHVDGLETAHEGTAFREVAVVFLVGGGTDEAHAARFEVGFEEIGEVERAFARLACADEVVYLVDVGDGVALFGHAVDDAEEALLELAAILRTAEEAAELEGVDACTGQSFRHAAVANEGGETVDEGGFAHTGIADVERIVLVEAAEHADGAFEFRLAADERIVAVEMVVDAGDVAVPVVGGLSFCRGRCTGAGGREDLVIGGAGAVRIVRRVGVGAQAVDERRK